MAHLTYEESIKRVYYGLVLLGVVTLVEVFISLLGKGHIIPGAEKYKVVLYAAGLVIIALSLYKAYFIVYEFMHMRYEVKGLAMSVLLPTLLLIWAIIAFFQEGDSWKDRREQIKEKNELPAEGENPQGMLLDREDIYILG
jgi:TRAP-type C4-dicarboxylate transport system permease small subunit